MEYISSSCVLSFVMAVCAIMNETAECILNEIWSRKEEREKMTQNNTSSEERGGKSDVKMKREEDFFLSFPRYWKPGASS